MPIRLATTLNASKRLLNGHAQLTTSSNKLVAEVMYSTTFVMLVGVVVSRMHVGTSPFAPVGSLLGSLYRFRESYESHTRVIQESYESKSV